MVQLQLHWLFLRRGSQQIVAVGFDIPQVVVSRASYGQSCHHFLGYQLEAGNVVAPFGNELYAFAVAASCLLNNQVLGVLTRLKCVGGVALYILHNVRYVVGRQ